MLIAGPAWVGDMIMAQSLFMVLKRRDPAPRIHVLAPAWTLPVLERMPEVDATVEMPVGHGRLGFGRRLKLGRKLREVGYAQSIVLPNSWKSALTPFWARIPLRTGWLGEMRYGLLNDARRIDKRRWPLMVDRFVALAYPETQADAVPAAPGPRLEIKAVQVQQALRDLGIQKRARRPLLALCPGAEFGLSKCWPARYYGELAAHMQRSGWDVWLFGSRNDAPICKEVNAAAGGICADLSGRTRLGQAVDLLSLADRVVSNDSGLMHVAAALGHPLVAVFGSTDPTHTPPLSDKARVVSLGLDCSPCFKRSCPLGHNNCMRQLPVERVLQALDVEV